MTRREQSRSRLAKCLDCPALLQARRPLEKCRECGCFVRAIVQIPGKKCPRGKW